MAAAWAVQRSTQHKAQRVHARPSRASPASPAGNACGIYGPCVERDPSPRQVMVAPTPPNAHSPHHHDFEARLQQQLRHRGLI